MLVLEDMRGDVRWDGDCQRRRAHWRLEGIVGLLFVLMEPLIERIDASIYRGGLVSMTDRITNRTIATSPQKRAENGKIARDRTTSPCGLEYASTACWTDKVGGVKSGRWRMADGASRMAMMSVEE